MSLLMGTRSRCAQTPHMNGWRKHSQWRLLSYDCVCVRVCVNHCVYNGYQGIPSAFTFCQQNTGALKPYQFPLIEIRPPANQVKRHKHTNSSEVLATQACKHPIQQGRCWIKDPATIKWLFSLLCFIYLCLSDCLSFQTHTQPLSVTHKHTSLQSICAFLRHIPCCNLLIPETQSRSPPGVSSDKLRQQRCQKHYRSNLLRKKHTFPK